MKIKQVASATLLTASAAAAFTIHTLNDNNRAVLSSSSSSSTTKTRGTSLSSTTTPCDIPQDIKPIDLVSQKGSASILRSVVLTNVDGDFISLGKLMGKGKSIIVFLRHMG